MLEEFSYEPTPAATDPDQPFMSIHLSRNGRVGKLVRSDAAHPVYKLHARKLGLA